MKLLVRFLMPLPLWLSAACYSEHSADDGEHRADDVVDREALRVDAGVSCSLRELKHCLVKACNCSNFPEGLVAPTHDVRRVTTAEGGACDDANTGIDDAGLDDAGLSGPTRPTCLNCK